MQGGVGAGDEYVEVPVQAKGRKIRRIGFRTLGSYHAQKNAARAQCFQRALYAGEDAHPAGALALSLPPGAHDARMLLFRHANGVQNFLPGHAERIEQRFCGELQSQLHLQRLLKPRKVGAGGIQQRTVDVESDAAIPHACAPAIKRSISLQISLCPSAEGWMPSTHKSDLKSRATRKASRKLSTVQFSLLPISATAMA